MYVRESASVPACVRACVPICLCSTTVSKMASIYVRRAKIAPNSSRNRINAYV